jgi:hypothetical protein
MVVQTLNVLTLKGSFTCLKITKKFDSDKRSSLFCWNSCQKDKGTLTMILEPSYETFYSHNVKIFVIS